MGGATLSPITPLDDLPAGLRNAVIAEVQRKVDAEQVKTVQEQALIAAQTGEHRSMDGLGRPYLNVHGTAFHYWGQRLGYECWKDKGFLREFWRDNPGARIKSVGTKLLLGWHPSEPTPKRFRKKYGS